MADYNKRSFDLSSVLPARIRDKTLSTLIKNLFNRYLTKSETAPLYGYVGSEKLAVEGDVYLQPSDLDRAINALMPAIYVKHATTERAFTWNDILQKLRILGVDTSKLDSWGAVKSFNWVPPINLDKFINFSEYYWIGSWVQTAIEAARNDWSVLTGPGETTDGYEDRVSDVRILSNTYYTTDENVDEVWWITMLSPTTFSVVGTVNGSEPNGTLASSGDTLYTGNLITFKLKEGFYEPGTQIQFSTHDNSNLYATIFYNADASINLLNNRLTLALESQFAKNNPTFKPDYYVIKRKASNDLTGWTAWSAENLWVHKDDISAFVAAVAAPLFSTADLVQAKRPIIEYDNDLQLSGFVTSQGVPSDTGTAYTQAKVGPNQPPLFDLYLSNGVHAGKISPLFYYAEGNNYPVDEELGRRLVTDQFGEFTFEQGLIIDEDLDGDPADTGESQFLLYFKKAGVLTSIWKDGYTATPQYLKLDDRGNLINEDKLRNYKNYYWVGLWSDLTAFPGYYGSNAGQPEYTVIEAGGTSDWSLYNYWAHVTDINPSLLSNYIQAQKPIIEFNKNLEAELVAAKSAFNELPRFKLYVFNDVTDSYDLIPTVGNPDDVDIVGNNYLFIANDDLPTSAEAGNLRLPETLGSLVDVDGRKYVQSLLTYYFKLRDNDPDFHGAGDGTITNLTIESAGGVQEWWLERDATDPTLFDVRGSISGVDATQAVVGTPYNNGSISFTINAGTVPFELGDYFTFKFLSSYLYKVTHYVKVGDSYKTIEIPEQIVTGLPPQPYIPASVTDGDGVWKVPEPMFFNLNNENRRQVKQGDLYYHFGSIIEAQSGLVGGALSANNFRKLSPDLGLGGRIKQYNGAWNLFVGLMCQQNITPLSLLEFGKQQYGKLQVQALEYALAQGIDDLTAGSYTVSDPDYDDKIFDLFKTYISGQNQVVLDSASVVDDNIAQLFYDTTSPIPNTPITLPMLGLAAKVAPSIAFDANLGVNMLTHHDGHRTTAYTYTVDTIKKYINKSYTRSNGQISAGHVTAGVAPEKPFKNQFWFNTVTNQLKYYNVVSDTGETPTGQLTGAFSYDRTADTLKQYNGTAWIAYGGALTDPWTLVPNIVDTLQLRIEQELYNNIPPTTMKLDTAALEADGDYEPLIQAQFEKFGRVHGVNDVYGVQYNAGNAFTWNYSSVTVSPLSTAYPTWQQLYTAYYGTPRPDLYPWLVVNHFNATSYTQATWNTYLAGLTVTPFTPSMWSVVKALIGGRPLSVNPSTNELLPPFIKTGEPNAAEALINVQPAGIINRFEFGQLGPIEVAWRNSIDYLYDKAKVYFKLDPITFVDSTWGYHHVTVGGSDYRLFKELNKKLQQIEFKLHGEPRYNLVRGGDITNIVIPGGSGTNTYTVTVINRLDNYYKVTRQSTGAVSYVQLGSTYTDSATSVSFKLSDIDYRGLKQGDTFTVTTVASPSSSTVTFTPAEKHYFIGLNQLYVQLLRSQANSLDTALNVSILRAWENLLSYRVGGFVNTETLKVISDNFDLAESDYKILIKENKFLNNVWLNSIRIQLVQVGSTGYENGFSFPLQTGNYQHGADWVFKIENFNHRVPNIRYHELGGNYVTFKALNSQRTDIEWRRYTDVLSTKTEAAPFLITGVTNLLNFLFGYVSYLESVGWKFNDAENPVIDDQTGRLVGWQLEIERMINSLYSSPPAGSSFIMNPFKRAVWFKTPRGVVADLTRHSVYDVEASQAILNINGREILPQNIRVFRGDEITEVISDEPMYTVHLTVSEYEHIMLFNSYAADINLLYDAFLGQRVSRLLLTGDKQVEFNGRLSFGGQYLHQDAMRKNIEASVEGLVKLYDVSQLSENDPVADRALALINFENKSYFKDLHIPLRSSVKFWQGMIKNKGSNFSIEAFTNSSRYEATNLDEYWAFKIAEYGDARLIQDPELRINLDDVSADQTRYRFLEVGEADAADNDGYDIKIMDGSPPTFDGANLGPAEFDGGMPNGCILIEPQDEARWFTMDDMLLHQYFIADRVANVLIKPTSVTAIYDVRGSDGKPVVADTFEIVDESDATRKVYFERGELQSDNTFTTPSFIRLNGSTIRITNAALLNHNLRVRCYRRPNDRYGPFRVVNYRDNVTAAAGIPVWDPQCGRHHPEAFKNVDIVAPNDPSRYNRTNLTAGNMNYDVVRPWGEKEVGRIWWNTKHLDYRPYSDSKIFSAEQRLALWGAKAHYSSIEAYQWIESPVPPEAYLTAVADQNLNDGSEEFRYSGEPAVKNLLVRGRKWLHRTVAWKYAENPTLTKRWLNTSADCRIKLNATTVGATTAVLSFGRMSTVGLAIGDKFCNALFSTTDKTSTGTITKVFGESVITDEEEFVVGTSDSYEDGGYFPVYESANGYFDSIRLTLDQGALSGYLSDVYGAITFGSEYNADTETYYIYAYCAAADKTQRIEVQDTPISGGRVKYVFDELGITLTSTCLLPHTPAWPDQSNPTTAAERMAIVASTFGNPDFNVFIRSKLTITNLLPYRYDYVLHGAPGYIETSELLHTTDEPQMCWVSWTDPTDINVDPNPPFNRWEPIFGDFMDIGDDLSTVEPFIKLEAATPFVLSNGQYVKKYAHIWSPWEVSEDKYKHVKYVKTTTQEAFCEDELVVTLSTVSDIRLRTTVYVNGRKLDLNEYYFATTNGVDPFVNITTILREGDTVTLKIAKYEPTPDELEFNPELNPTEEEPMKLLQYRWDYPYVIKETYSQYGVKAASRYFYWVKNLTNKLGSKSMPVKQVASLLDNNTDPYAIIEGLKFYNQRNGKPNRFALLILKNLNKYVGAEDTFKLRVSANQALRDDDENISLKNYHKEWILIRELQSSKIPKQLWDTLTNSACGETALGETLPSFKRRLYDQKFGTSTRYGFGRDQIFVDRAVAIDTIEYTVLNTKLTKFVSGEFVPDTIDFSVFSSAYNDVDELATYLSSPATTRALLDEIWLLAKPRQVNEIFFAVLHDALVMNPTLSDLFKTSFVALQATIPVQTTDLVNTIEYY